MCCGWIDVLHLGGLSGLPCLPGGPLHGLATTCSVLTDLFSSRLYLSSILFVSGMCVSLVFASTPPPLTLLSLLLLPVHNQSVSWGGKRDMNLFRRITGEGGRAGRPLVFF